jgi:citrate synthase
MTLDGNRHFGAIHDMTAFINQIESLDAAALEEAIQQRMLTALPTFGHPEIAAAGRSDEIQQDPRPAIYFNPFLEALDNGDIQLSDRQRKRLRVAQRIYQLAFIEGFIRPGREDQPPLRLTPNTDFGGWSVQEGLDIYETDRTLLTYIFRGFGWMMDAREQLQLKIIRPVIPPHPDVIPKPTDDMTIPSEVVALHNRMADADAFSG